MTQPVPQPASQPLGLAPLLEQEATTVVRVYKESKALQVGCTQLTKELLAEKEKLP